MKVASLFRDFIDSERSGGIVLIVCTVLSIALANSSLHDTYHALWSFPIAGHSFEHWINDGLMAIFFLLIGLELEREVYIGELSTLRKASLPVIAALGGMVVPAFIYFLCNHGGVGADGIGIPMATDIAFALGILSLLGKRVPVALKVFLTALAVIDDLGAIVVIAVFYTKTLVLMNLAISLGIFGVLLILNRLRVHVLWPYLIGGVAMWYFMLHSGVHATITGVLLAFAIPFANGDEKSNSYKLQHILHRPVAFIILPVFALANTAVVFENSVGHALMEWSSIGILAGLIIGKPIGISLFSLAAITMKWSSLPKAISKKALLGAGMLGGIGFTMSIFITLLAFNDQTLINHSKIAILIASTSAGILGFLFLKAVLPNQEYVDDTISNSEV